VVEILAGCRSRREQRQADAELACYQILWPSEATFAAALTFYRRFQLSHGAGFLDCLVAATAAEHGLRLATLNLRHFQPLPGVESVRPYAD
jgi:predicted nucleic acid-binding protein